MDQTAVEPLLSLNDEGRPACKGHPARGGGTPARPRPRDSPESGHPVGGDPALCPPPVIGAVPGTEPPDTAPLAARPPGRRTKFSRSPAAIVPDAESGTPQPCRTRFHSSSSRLRRPAPRGSRRSPTPDIPDSGAPAPRVPPCSEGAPQLRALPAPGTAVCQALPCSRISALPDSLAPGLGLRTGGPHVAGAPQTLAVMDN